MISQYGLLHDIPTVHLIKVGNKIYIIKFFWEVDRKLIKLFWYDDISKIQIIYDG